MLTAIHERSGHKVEADAAHKEDAPFLCPACGQVAILKKGRIVCHHFAHKPPVTCDYGSGETEQHRLAKKEIAAALREKKHVKSVEIERRLGPVVADVYCEYVAFTSLAIEVQISKLTMQQIIERTNAYYDLGITVLWLVPWRDELNLKRFSPHQYEKWLHVLNYGRVYYWVGGTEVLPVHFGDFMLWKDPTDFGGGYFYASKRYRTPDPSPTRLDFISQFHAVERGPEEIGRYALPSRCIAIDGGEPWWKTRAASQ